MPASPNNAPSIRLVQTATLPAGCRRNDMKPRDRPSHHSAEPMKAPATNTAMPAELAA
jgi:hypothetical protein